MQVIFIPEKGGFAKEACVELKKVENLPKKHSDHHMRSFSIWLLLLVHLGVRGSFAQTSPKQDSLLAILAKTPSDSAKVQLLLDIAKLYHTAPEARPWIDKAMALSRTANYQLGIANCLTNYNNYLYIEGKYDEVLKNCAIGIRIARPLKAHKTLGVLYNYIANIHNAKGEQRQALAAYQNALNEINQAVVPAFFPITIEGNIVKLYIDLREYKKALTYGLQAIEQAEKTGSTDAAGYISQHVGTAYLVLKQIPRSRFYFEKSLKIAHQTNDPHLIASVLSNLGEIYSQEGNAPKALAYYDQSLRIARANQDSEIEMWNLHGIAQEHYWKKEWQQAYDVTQQARQIAEKNQYKEYLTNFYLLLSDIEIGRGRLREGDAWRQKWHDLRTSISNETVLRATQELETRYQTAKKIAQINVLQQEQQIQQLSLRQKNLLIYSLAVLLVLAGVLGFLYYRYARQKQRLAQQENQLNEQKIIQLEQEKQLSAVDGMLRGQEEERSRLARDLHDGLGGMLSGIKSSLTGMSGNQIIPEESALAFGRVIDTLDSSIQELRRVARNMMPEALVRFGLKDALQDYVDYLNRSGGQAIDYQTFGLDERLPQATEIIIFRIVQELLNNVQKHANATQTLVQLIRDGSRFNLTVEDNGKGFDTSQLANEQGIGWLNIQSRVDYLNGTLDVTSAPGKGTSVTIEFIV
ncbi:tetratricopeptide repeat protein [Spirosoma sp. HMF4905]|uniref:Tetratricopeptide repeat protein n=1 Tax=Spirosoma arboris TaxID=2682092 RepID=A0A7K1SFL2_9BACT|nr:tetratricopeptide repeat protein [Spirosoma arboris]MVM32571.1 tetratricopeptide repeat protein [Spirosoma arboris]